MAARIAQRFSDGGGNASGHRLGVLLHVTGLWVEPFQPVIAIAMNVPFTVENDGFTAAGALVNAE